MSSLLLTRIMPKLHKYQPRSSFFVSENMFIDGTLIPPAMNPPSRLSRTHDTCPTYIPLPEPMIPHLVAHLADPSQTILVTIRSLTFHCFIFLVTLKIYHEIDLLIFSLSIEFSITLKSLMVTGCWSWQGEPKSESFHLSQIFSNHCYGRSISYSLNHYWHTYILFMWKSVIYLKSLKWISSLILSLWA